MMVLRRRKLEFFTMKEMKMKTLNNEKRKLCYNYSYEVMIINLLKTSYIIYLKLISPLPPRC